MNTGGLAQHYGSLTPEERFRLIVAAGARGDQAEQARLISAGGRIRLSFQDHAPHAHAFGELAVQVYLDLLEEAARYADAFDLLRVDQSGGEPGDEAGDAEAEDAAAEEEGTPAIRRLDLVLVAGFVLRTKAEGWKLFCARLSVPPFALMEGLPGFDRLRRALALTERAAFVPEGFLRWLNEARPAGAAEMSEVPLTAEGVADEVERLFRDRVAWWGG
jgi:hypothetical protein